MTLAKIAKKTTGMVDLVVPAHPASTILVESETWTGAVKGEEYLHDANVEGRDVDFYDPRTPKEN